MPSAHVKHRSQSLETPLLRKVVKHFQVEATFSFPVYLQFIEPLDPWCKVKLINITCKWRLPVLEKTEELHQKTRKIMENSLYASLYVEAQSMKRSLWFPDLPQA